MKKYEAWEGQRTYLILLLKTTFHPRILDIDLITKKCGRTASGLEASLKLRAHAEMGVNAEMGVTYYVITFVWFYTPFPLRNQIWH